jgi:hypothetical protein
VTIYTKHNALIHLDNMRNGPPRLQRWAIFLSQYNYNIVHKKGLTNLCAEALLRRTYEIPVEDDGDDIDFITHITEQPSTKTTGKTKCKNKTLQLITFYNGTVETIDAVDTTGEDETVGNASTEAQSSLSSITQTDPRVDTIMGGKYDIKLLQSEDSDFQDIVAYLTDGILEPDDKKARKTILEAENYSWSPSEGLHRMWISRSKNLDQLAP